MNRRNAIHLTEDERMLINIYMTQYNQVNSQIDYLYSRLDQIRASINQIHQRHEEENLNASTDATATTTNTNANTNANTNTNTNTNTYATNNGYPLRIRNNLRSRYTNLIPRFYNYYDYYGNRMRNLNPVFYDYNNPINPSLYTMNNDGFTLRNLVNRLFGEENVAPTTGQIHNATRNVIYGNIQNPISDVCPISLNRFQPNDVVTQIHHCGHIFGRDDATSWFSRSSLCPVCRYDIRNYQQQDSQTQTHNIQVATNLDDYSDTETEEDEYEESKNDDFSNANVRRNANNNVSEVSFDISNNSTMANSLFANLTQNLLQSVLYGDFSHPNGNRNIYNYRLGDQEFVFDASNNVLMYETIIRPNSNTWR
jgi:hypothetical protein